MSTAVDDVLLALERRASFSDKFAVPFEITQEGLAQKVGIDKSQVSRILKRLEESEMVYSEKRHVGERKRRMNAYFLTAKGRIELKTMRDEGVIKRYTDFASQRPKVRRFYGREEEMDIFHDWFRSPRTKIFVVKGMAGIGKTVFISKTIDQFCQETNLFWYKFHEWSSLRPFLTRFAEFLSEVGKKSLESYLDNKEVMDINELSFILEKDLENMNALLVFDDYQKLQNKDIKRIFGSLVELLPRTIMTKMIVIGRDVPRFYYDIKDVAIQKTVQELTLSGLDENSSLQFLSTKSVDAEECKRIYDVTRGHPLALSLVEGGKSVHRYSMKEYLEEEVMSQLSTEERAILDVASLFRDPAPAAIYLEIAGGYVERNTPEESKNTSGSELTADAGRDADRRPWGEIGHSVISGLVKKSLMHTVGDDEFYGVHDLIKSFCSGRMLPSNRKQYHTIIANYYLEEKNRSSQNTLEALYHLLEANLLQRVTDISLESGRELIYKGYWQEFLEVIEQISLDTIDPKQKPWMLLLRGKIYTMQAELDKALGNYMPSTKLFAGIGDRAGEAEAYRDIGETMWKRNSYEEALENYFISIDLSNEAGDEKGLAESHRGVGRVFWRRGESEKALHYFEEALEYSKRSMDELMTARLYKDIASTFMYTGRYDKTIEYLDRSIPMAKRTGDKDLIFGLLNNKGVAYHFKGEFSNSVEWSEKAIAVAEEYGYMSDLVTGLSNAAESLLHLGELDKALEYCKKAEKLAIGLKEKDTVAHLYMIFGQIYSKKKEWDKSEEQYVNALELAKNAGVPDIIAQVHLHYARLLNMAGKKDLSRKQYLQCIDLFERLENTRKMESATKEMEELKS
ncbi:MAG: tetratricopeptide repeat protein [Thermoplasmata archaeon]|nr:tetratricopeptide repeat protein [Thermoplasmata archaeon]